MYIYFINSKFNQKYKMYTFVEQFFCETYFCQFLCTISENGTHFSLFSSLLVLMIRVGQLR